MKMMTKAIEKQIPKLYAQDGKGYEAIVYVKYFDPWSGSTWFGTEYDPSEKLFFGWICLNGDLQCAEFGCFSLNEMESPRRIERDMYFKPCTLREAIKDKYDYNV